MEFDRVFADAQFRCDGPVAVTGDKVLEYFEFPSGKVPSGYVPGQGGRRSQRKSNNYVCTPARHNVDLQVAG